MSDLAASVKDLKENLQFFVGDEVAELSDDKLIELASNYISELEIENSLLMFAVENSIQAPIFERWFELANKRLDELSEEETFTDENLLEILKECQN